MTKITQARKAGDGKRALRDVGLALAVLGAGAFLASYAVPGPAAHYIRAAAPWAVFIGALLLVLYFVVRNASAPGRAKPADAIVFGQSTTTFHEAPPFEKR